MSSNPMEADLWTKQEGLDSNNDGNLGYKASNSSVPWIRTKDPRVVRVSRAFGGKDRHSKVFTIRGLRDRRVRLSAPTAIQLYDLQDRLGLNQPSKVVDWLLNAAKNEIDGLPPLPVIPGHFSQNNQEMLTSHQATASSNEGLKGKGNIDLEDSGGLLRRNFWSSSALWNDKSKEVARDAVNKEAQEDIQEENEGRYASSTYNFLSKTYHPSFQGELNNAMPYGSYQNSMLTNNSPCHGFSSQAGDLPNFNIVAMPSTLSLSGSQILVCPPGATQAYLPSSVSSSMEIDSKQVNHFQVVSSNTHTLLSNSFATDPLHSTSQNMRPLHFNWTPKHALDSQDSGACQPRKDH